MLIFSGFYYLCIRNRHFGNSGFGNNIKKKL